jgi:hypothetical protein
VTHARALTLPTDPLVLDLNGDGVRLTDYLTAPMFFDADNDGGSLRTVPNCRWQLDSQVDQLVGAMAAFAPPAAGQTSLPQNYKEALNTVIASNWQ